MRFLIDTHTFLWFVMDDSKLSHHALALIENDTNVVFLSAMSLWEMAIKFSIGKLTLNQPFQTFIDEQFQANDIQLLSLEVSHIKRVADLPLHHRDPFDRMLIVQSMVENLPIVSADPVFDAYGISRLW